jgi:hypothetical protein
MMTTTTHGGPTRVDLIAEPIRRTADGLEVPVNSFWYRALPLSCTTFEVSIDGTPVSAAQIRVHVNERDYLLDELPEREDETWFVLDAARLRITAELSPGEHELEVGLVHWIPYLFDEETREHLRLRNVERRRFELPAEFIA